MRGFLRHVLPIRAAAHKHQQRTERLRQRKRHFALNGFVDRQRRQNQCARAQRAAPELFRLVRLLLPAFFEDELSLRTRSAKAVGHPLGERHDRLLSLAGKIVLFILRQIAGNLLKHHRRGRYCLRHVLRGFKLLTQRFFSVFKSGDCVHMRPPFRLNLEFWVSFIVPAAAGFVN